MREITPMRKVMFKRLTQFWVLNFFCLQRLFCKLKSFFASSLEIRNYDFACFRWHTVFLFTLLFKRLIGNKCNDTLFLFIGKQVSCGSKTLNSPWLNSQVP